MTVRTYARNQTIRFKIIFTCNKPTTVKRAKCVNVTLNVVNFGLEPQTLNV